MATNYRRLSDISLRMGSLISSLRNVTEQDCCHERDGGIYELVSRVGGELNLEGPYNQVYTVER